MTFKIRVTNNSNHVPNSQVSLILRMAHISAACSFRSHQAWKDHMIYKIRAIPRPIKVAIRYMAHKLFKGSFTSQGSPKPPSWAWRCSGPTQTQSRTRPLACQAAVISVAPFRHCRAGTSLKRDEDMCVCIHGDTQGSLFQNYHSQYHNCFSMPLNNNA